jgi:hypothetical protein
MRVRFAQHRSQIKGQNFQTGPLPTLAPFERVSRNRSGCTLLFIDIEGRDLLISRGDAQAA